MYTLESLYSPSHWSKRHKKEIAVEKHIEFLNSASLNITKSIPTRDNIPYGPGSRQKYSIIGTDLKPDSPILIIIHGGYWQAEEITHQNMIFMSPICHKNKVKLITIGYDLCPVVTLQEIIDQVKTAIQICLNYAKVNKSCGLYLLGHSAGAHILAVLLESFLYNLPNDEQSLIKEIFLISGIYDITPLIHTTVNEALKLNSQDAKELSPYLVELNSPKHIIVHVIVAEHDSPSFIQQAIHFQVKLINSNITSRYNLINEEDHFSIMEKLTDENFDLMQVIFKSINKNSDKIKE